MSDAVWHIAGKTYIAHAVDSDDREAVSDRIAAVLERLQDEIERLQKVNRALVLDMHIFSNEVRNIAGRLDFEADRLKEPTDE